MRRQLVEFDTEANLSKGSIINHWRNHIGQLSANFTNAVLSAKMSSLESLARQRNLIAHGIQSVSSDPWEPDSAFVDCRGADGETRRLTIHMIRKLSEDIDEFRRSLRHLRRSS